MADIKNEIPDQEYAYGFNDGDVVIFNNNISFINCFTNQ